MKKYLKHALVLGALALALNTPAAMATELSAETQQEMPAEAQDSACETVAEDGSIVVDENCMMQKEAHAHEGMEAAAPEADSAEMPATHEEQ